MNDNQQHEKFMRIAIGIAEENVLQNLGGPFGAVIVKDGKIIAKNLRGEAPDARLQEILGAVNKISYTTALCDGLVSSRLQPWPVSL